jgi:hypothetical protein
MAMRAGATVQLQIDDNTDVVRHRGFPLGSDNTDPAVGAIFEKVDIAVWMGVVLEVIPAHRASGGCVDHDCCCRRKRR